MLIIDEPKNFFSDGFFQRMTNISDQTDSFIIFKNKPHVGNTETLHSTKKFSCAHLLDGKKRLDYNRNEKKKIYEKKWLTVLCVHICLCVCVENVFV